MIKKAPTTSLIIFHFIAILFAMLNIINVEIAGFSKVLPLFDVMIVFYFSVFVHVFGMWFVFLLGIFNDALSGNPLGLTSLIYIILIYFFAAANHRLIVREDFKQILYQFMIFLFIYLFAKWLFLSLYNDSVYGIATLSVQFILSSVFYVIMHKFCDYLNQKFVNVS
jgi:rod shape-determining protein MreD